MVKSYRLWRSRFGNTWSNASDEQCRTELFSWVALNEATLLWEDFPLPSISIIFEGKVVLWSQKRTVCAKCGFGREDHFHIVFPFKRTCPLSNHQTERSLAEEWKLAEDVCLTMEMFPGICSIPSPRSQPPFFLILNGSSFWMMRNLTIRTWWFLSTNL